MIKIKNVNANILKSDCEFNEKIFEGYLFHGTRRGMITCSDEERSMFLSKCELLLKYLKKNNKQILKDNNITKEKLGLDGAYFYQSCSLFRYGDFYLTQNYLEAIDFANLGAGELGSYAYCDACAIRKAGIKLDNQEIENVIDLIIETYNKISQTEKVVLCLKNVDFNDLKNGKGNEFTDWYKNRLFKAITRVNIISQENFVCRLTNVGKYEFELVSQDDIKKLIPIFTNIEEKDICKLECIRNL